MSRREVLAAFDQQKEYLDEKVLYGIETYRKGNAEIILKDSRGKAINGASIKINQTSHAFKYGANIFMLEEFETPEKNELYKKYFSDVFNMATLPFYWDAVEPEKGKQRYDKDSPKIYRRPPIDLCLEFCEKHCIEPREHALAYDNFFPGWLANATVDEVKTELERRYREISERYADKIPTIEVTNEMLWDTGKTAFYNAPDFVEWCFKTAEKYFPHNQLVINEYSDPCWHGKCRTTDNYYSYIEANILKGARIDAIGAQFHMFFRREQEMASTKPFYDPKSLYKHMDMYALLGKPLQITEVTIPSYSWEAEDEEIQAEIIDKLYSIWFSHPSVEQIIYWNLVDGYAHVPDSNPENIRATQGNMAVGENYFHGGLFRFDMTPKPAYYKICELFKDRWHTETERVTDQNGVAAFRGFYGNYELNITVNGNTVTKKVELKKYRENNFEITL